METNWGFNSRGFNSRVVDGREATHGDFLMNADIAQRLKTALTTGPSWDGMSPVQRESAHHICTKLSRIVSGNPDCLDHWDDIAGYAELVSRTLR